MWTQNYLYLLNFFPVNYLTPGKDGEEGKSDPLSLILIYVFLRFLQGGGTGKLFAVSDKPDEVLYRDTRYEGKNRSVLKRFPTRNQHNRNLSPQFEKFASTVV